MAKDSDPLGEVPANGTDSPRGDYLPMVEPPAGLEDGIPPQPLDGGDEEA